MELEGLRGVAAVAVVIYHVLLCFFPVMFYGFAARSPVQHVRFEDNLYATPIAGFLSGQFAVAIFFVLSGFVLSVGFFATGKVEIIKKLAIKRYLRLMLPALAMVLGCYLLIKLGLSQLRAAGEISRSHALLDSWNFAPSLYEAIKSAVYGSFVEGSNAYNGVLWTMTTEFWGSLLVFGSVLLFTGSKYRWVAYAALAAATFNTWFFGFVVGMVLADLYSKGWIKQQTRSLLATFALLGTAIYLGGYPAGKGIHGEGLQNTVYGPLSAIPHSWFNHRMVFTTLGAILLVVVVLRSAQAASFFRTKYLSGLGKYTFSLYLVHIPILYTLTSGLFVYFTGFMGYNRAIALACFISLPVLVGVTVLFEKYVDAKSIKLSSYYAEIYNGQREVNWREKFVSIRMRAQMRYRSIAKGFALRRTGEDEA